MDLSINSEEFEKAVKKINTFNIDPNGKYQLNAYTININANEFDYDALVDSLREPVLTYALSRNYLKSNQDRPGHIHHAAKEQFKRLDDNTGELGELLLYAFLETQLKAPKILSKLELKTSDGMYVNGADGVHFLKIDENQYQLIFGESKTYTELDEAIYKAFTSIHDFKNNISNKGHKKSGITFERSLISDNLTKESFDEDDIKFIQSLIYPTKNTNSNINVDNAFGIFIGYEMQIDDSIKMLPNAEGRKTIEDMISATIEGMKSTIIKQLKSKNLLGHSFYIYIMPFTEIEEKRIELLKEILD